MRARLPRSATFAIGTDSARGAEREHERDGDAAMPTPKWSAMVGGDGERDAGDLVDGVEAEEDEQRPDRPGAGEPSSQRPGWRRRGGRARTRARPTPAAAPSGSRRTSPTGVGTSSCTSAGVARSGTAASCSSAVATSARRLGTTMPLRRASHRNQRSRARKKAPLNPPGSRSSTTSTPMPDAASRHRSVRNHSPPLRKIAPSTAPSTEPRPPTTAAVKRMRFSSGG